MQTWIAPGRVNLIGEHTDYNDGLVLPLAIDRHTRVSASPRADGVLRCRSTQQAEEHDLPLVDVLDGHQEPGWGWAVYVAGVAWALAGEGVDVDGADVSVTSDLPTGAGLSSSAALEVAAAGALSDLAGAPLEPARLAAVAHRAETVFVGVPTGVMDQLVVARARAGHAMFIDTRSGATEDVPLTPEEHGLSLVLIDSGVRRSLVDGRYAERRRQCEQAAKELGVESLRDATTADLARLPGILACRARHVLSENDRVLEVVELLRAGRLAEIGPALLASHASLRDDFEVSCPELDAAVEGALAAGALGARMTGGGFGGYVIALVAAPGARVLGGEVVRVVGGARRADGAGSGVTEHS